tara:strand:- start:220 stop:2118 length:1899 start_codon:yes stop_codon:yes gene_type:complete
MSCSFQNKVQDIEELIKEDSKFEAIKTKYDTFKSIIFDIENWVSENKNKPNLKSKFNQYYHKFQHKYKTYVSKALLIYVYKKMIMENKIENIPQMWKLLRKKPCRNISGVDVITIVMHPFPKDENGVPQKFTCKHDCYYCPDEPPTKENGYLPPPRSYLSKEPAVARGLRNGYNEIDQINERITTLIKNGHEADKLEYIIEGGTHSEFPMAYLDNFHRNIIYAANVYYDINKREPLSVEKEIEINKTATIKIIGISIETRPDNIVENPVWLSRYRNWGVTRIQLGVQHTDNTILKLINRGHTIETSIDAIQKCKEHGFKVEIHIMLDLPGSSPRKDMIMLEEVFLNENINPDYIKLYPCAVTPWTIIEKWFHGGKYKPYASREIIPGEFSIIDVMKYGIMLCPPTTRISRVVRDIPTSYIKGGNNVPNLRQLVEKELEYAGEEIKCIRYRECGRHPEYNMKDAVYTYSSYETTNGKEYFISLESVDEKVIFGFLRLRIPYVDNTQFKCLNNKAIVRELHVYGNLIPVGENNSEETQHKGIGKKLLGLAETLSKEENKKGVAIISGIGVRGYYEKRGYKLEETYMVKYFNNENYENMNLVFMFVLLIICWIIMFYTIPLEFIKEYFINESWCN